MHIFYEVARGGEPVTEFTVHATSTPLKLHHTHSSLPIHTDFCAADVDSQSQTHTMTRMALAVALAPDMRTLQQQAMRELNTGAMTVSAREATSMRKLRCEQEPSIRCNRNSRAPRGPFIQSIAQRLQSIICFGVSDLDTTHSLCRLLAGGADALVRRLGHDRGGGHSVS